MNDDDDDDGGTESRFRCHPSSLSVSQCVLCVCVCSRGWGKVTEKRKKLGGLKRVRIRDGIKR